jgi:hypothetical protein
MSEIERRVSDLLQRRGDAATPAIEPMPGRLRARIRRRRIASVILGCGLVVALVTLGANVNGLLRSAAIPAGEPTDVPPRGDPVPTRVELAPGTYVADRFAVPFSFEVVRGEHLAVWEHEAAIVTPTRHSARSLDDGRGGVEVIAVRAVIAPRTREAVPPPDDLVRWIERHPTLEVDSSTPASIGGLDGVLLDVSSERGAELAPHVPLVWEHRIGLNTGARTEMYVLDAGGTWVVILPVRAIDRHQRHVADADSAFAPEDLAFLGTVDFSPSTS